MPIATRRAWPVMCINNRKQAKPRGMYQATWCAKLTWAIVIQGRDANRKIKRAISAGKQREQLPGMVAQASLALQEFRDQEGRSFAYDGLDYQVKRLQAVKVLRRLFAVAVCAVSLCS